MRRRNRTLRLTVHGATSSARAFASISFRVESPQLLHSPTLFLLLSSLLLSSFPPLRPAAHAELPNYEQDVKPLLRDQCLKCHNADEKNSDLDLSTFAALMKGGSSGAVVSAGRPESSQLYRAIAHLEGAEAMPPEKPRLPEEKLGLVRDWIRGGLIAGKGGKSQLRSVEQIANVAQRLADLPRVMPEQLPNAIIAKTIRKPVPQALAASPCAPLVAVSGQEQVLLYEVVRKSDEGKSEEKGEQERRGGDQDTTQHGARLQLLGALAFPEGTLHDLRFSPTGTLLLAAGGRGAHSGRVVIYDVKSGKRLAEIGDEVESVLSADITADHRLLALGGPSKVVKVFDTKTGEQLYRIQKHTDWITALAFSPDGKLLATGDRSGGIHVWESESGAIVYTLDEHKVRVTALDWRGDGKLLASSAEDGVIILWDTKDGWPVRNIAAHVAKSPTRYTRYTGTLSVCFSPDGRLLSAGRDRTIRLWNAEGRKLAEYRRDSIPLSATFLPDDKFIVSSHFDGETRLESLDK